MRIIIVVLSPKTARTLNREKVRRSCAAVGQKRIKQNVCVHKMADRCSEWKVAQFSAAAWTCKVRRIIIGSDRQPETKQGKIVKFRTSDRAYVTSGFIISCRCRFVQFGINLNHVIPKHGVIWRFYRNAQVSFRCVFVFGLQVCSFSATVVTYDS